MIAHAAAIAEKLQGAHERRQERRRGEDTDMDESVWESEIERAIATLRVSMQEMARQIRAGSAPGDPQASAVSAERVVELERQRDTAMREYRELQEKFIELERRAENAEQDMEEAERQRAERGEVGELEHLLATAYVPREVPWADVAAGMMTISAQGEAWMVVELNSEYRFVLQNGTTTFEKLPKPTETVRVLVPYVTDAQAEATLRAAGAREVS